MFLSTTQTLPNQIPLGPAEMISLLKKILFSDVFILVEYVHVRTKKKNSLPKDFGLLGVWFTEFTLY